MSKILYEPFKYKGNGNFKYSVYVMSDKGNKKLIYFGDNRYEDYTQHKDKIRQQSYLSTAKGIKNKAGELTWKNKNSKNYWAVKLWENVKPDWV